jgi:hypothetical protein
MWEHYRVVGNSGLVAGGPVLTFPPFSLFFVVQRKVRFSRSAR